jgi:RNA polymerase sigma-70 factor (ECF subfamily)
MMNDSEVIQSILNGKRDDFTILVEKYQQHIFQVAMGFVHEKEEAEDLTQEIFLNAWKYLPKFRGDSSFSTWLHRIAVNACLNNRRKNTKTLLTMVSQFFAKDRILQQEVFLNEENPEDLLIRKESNAWLQKALANLPENQHTAIVLSKYDDLSQKEIAEILHITEGAVEALIQRAKKNLREKLLSSLKAEHKRRKISD